MAFQPALLPAESWMRIMDGLKYHFGDDASLPADVAASIRGYLTAHAGRTGDPEVIRITEQPWFIKEHRYPPSVWQRPEIRAKSNYLAWPPPCRAGDLRRRLNGLTNKLGSSWRFALTDIRLFVWSIAYREAAGWLTDS